MAKLYCSRCKSTKSEGAGQIHYDCWPEMAQYGPIVMGRAVCECGCHLGEPFMVDADGLIPPKRE